MLDKLLHPHPGASEPESGGQYPGTQALSIADYHRIMQESFGAIAADIAKLRSEVSQAADRHVMVRATALNSAYQIPTGPWRSVVISRPSYSEVFTASYNTDVNATFDGAWSGIIAYDGITVFPFFGWHEFSLKAVTNPPSGWLMDLIFTTRKYESTGYFGY